MKVRVERKTFQAAFASAASVVPPKPVKDIYKNLLLGTTDHATLTGTDTEATIRVSVPGVFWEEPGELLLPIARMNEILRASNDTDIHIERDGDHLLVSGARSRFKLPTEDPGHYPRPSWRDNHEPIATVKAEPLRLALRRTMFATDPESTRYALGGALFGLTPGKLTIAATDGRRCAVDEFEADTKGMVGTPPVVPLRAMKTLDRLLPDADSVEIWPSDRTCEFHLGNAWLQSRLVEGRFPRYKDVFPDPSSYQGKAELTAGDFLQACQAAQITTNDESRGVDFTFNEGLVKLKSQGADVGSSLVELPLAYTGPSIETTFDPRYLADMLRTFEPGTTLRLDLIDDKNAAMFSFEGYRYVVMPLTRERK